MSVIPKTAAPADMSQLRNLSCTPLFSKVLESFVLDELKKETKLSNSQYGGIKGVSANHFLIGKWQKILESLEDQRAAVSVLSIDFQKAFNRMCHNSCMSALGELGAGPGVLGLVHAFLSDRTMSVKVGKEMSDPRTVPGGSPQGSILGNYLFCATTDSLTSEVQYEEPDDISLLEMSDTGVTEHQGVGDDVERQRDSNRLGRHDVVARR